MKKKRHDQSGAPGNWSTADGQAKKAKPGPEKLRYGFYFNLHFLIEERKIEIDKDPNRGEMQYCLLDFLKVQTTTDSYNTIINLNHANDLDIRHFLQDKVLF